MANTLPYQQKHRKTARTRTSHAPATALTSTDGRAAREVPGLQEVLARVSDPRKRRGRCYLLAFVLAVAVTCALAGARNFREVGDHAADPPQEVLRRLGGRPHPLLRRILAPSETRIRTLVHAIGAETLDEVIDSWLSNLPAETPASELVRLAKIRPLRDLTKYY